MESRRRFMPASRAGFVLAGGRSSRMGQDKALLPWKGSTLIESVAREVFNAAGSVTLIGPVERYASLGFPVVSDKIAGCGPLAGLHAALSTTTAEWNILVACDMPGMTCPLSAVYNARLLPAVESAIHSKLLKMHDFVSKISVRQWPAPDPAVCNLNTPEQLLGAR